MNKSSYIEKDKDKKLSLPAEAGVLVDDDIYFFSSEYNLLYKVHLPEFSISIISHIPCGEIMAFEWFRKMRYWNGKLIFVPSYAGKIWIYNLDKGLWDSITIDYPDIRLKFWGTVIYQDSIFMFGLSYPLILKVDLKSYHVLYINTNVMLNQENGLFLTDAVRVGDTAYCPVDVSNQVLQFHLDSLEYEWKQIGGADNRYSGISYDGCYFWISPGQRGKAVKWDGGSEWEEYEVPEEIADHPYLFIGVICDGNKVRFLTQQDGRSLEIINNKYDKAQVLLTESTKRYIHLERYENGTVILMKSDGSLDIKWNGKWISGICEINYKDFKAYIADEMVQNILANNIILNEDELLGQTEFIKMIVRRLENKDKDSRYNQFKDNLLGEKIYKVIKKSCV